MSSTYAHMKKPTDIVTPSFSWSFCVTIRGHCWFVASSIQHLTCLDKNLFFYLHHLLHLLRCFVSAGLALEYLNNAERILFMLYGLGSMPDGHYSLSRVFSPKKNPQHNKSYGTRISSKSQLNCVNL